MARLRIRVTDALWAYGDLVLPAGEHDLDRLDDDQIAAIGAAVASPAGIELVEADQAAQRKLAKAVETEEQSLKALAAAQESGAWHDGNLLAHEAAVAALGGDS